MKKILYIVALAAVTAVVALAASDSAVSPFDNRIAREVRDLALRVAALETGTLQVPTETSGSYTLLFIDGVLTPTPY